MARADELIEHIMELKESVAALGATMESHVDDVKEIRRDVDDLKSYSNKAKGAFAFLGIITTVLSVLVLLQKLGL